MTLDELAVVIPLGPGERAWRGLVAELAPLPPQARVVLVATAAGDLPAAGDGGLLALRAELVSLVAPRGRSLQLNAGARAADRPWLWFLHADSRLAAATLPALVATATCAPNALGYFDLRFAADGPAAVRLNELGAFVRSRILGLPFGDQGFFLAARVFERLGGFDPALACGEDHALVWTARRAAVALAPARAPLYTSARKYADHGWLATTARHLRLTAAQAWRGAWRARGVA
jgi:hypothetical protein